MAATPAAGGGDVTRLSLRDTARLAEVAGKVHAAMYAASDDQPFLRALLADALEGVDRVRGRCTAVAAVGPWPIEEHPRLPCQAPPAATGGDPPDAGRDKVRDNDRPPYGSDSRA